ncbi:hypothetical protein ACFQ9X_33110 [Catenulispora yoronensis]
MQTGWEVEETEPKPESSIRSVMLSDELAIESARYRQRQDMATPPPRSPGTSIPRCSTR